MGLSTGVPRGRAGGITRLSKNSVSNLKNKSHSITAQVVVPEGGGSGVIIAQGGASPAGALYLHVCHECGSEVGV
jgi:hypothetical protein